MVKRLGRILLAACIPAALSAIATTHAQDDPITICQRAPDADSRIACLEDALRDQTGATRPLAPGVRGHDAAPDEEASSQSAFGRVGGMIGAINPFSGGEAREEARTVSSQDPAAERFGASQVAARTTSRATETPSQSLDARITGVSVVPYQRLELTLDNGQVWRQIAGDSQRINERHADDNTVSIRETRLGGYQMRLNEISRTIRVERIR